MKNNKLPIGLNKLNFVLFLTLTFPIFAGDLEGKFSEEDLEEAFKREEKLDYGVVEAYFYKTAMRMVLENSLLPIDQSKNQVFSNRLEPEISFAKYFMKFRSLALDPAVLIATLINVHKFTQMTRAKITRFNLHRMFVVALMVTHKHESEIRYKNEVFAEYGNINLKELNIYEKLFLKTFKYRLVIQRHEYDAHVAKIKLFQQQLEQEAAAKLMTKN